MAAFAKNEDISLIRFVITLNNMNNFDSFKSNIFHVRNNPWMIKISKKKDMMAISLISCIKNAPIRWTVIAACSAKLISSKIHKKPHKAFIGPVGFYEGTLEWLSSTSIPWNMLMDPTNDYITNDTCKLEIEVKASPLQITTQHQWLTFESIQKCCNENSNDKFRLTVKVFDDFIGVCSPEFVLSNSKWRISVVKTEAIPVEYVQIRLRCIAPDTNWSERLTITSTLIPFNPNGQPLQKQIENQNYNHSAYNFAWNLITWDDLILPLNQYIENNSFVLEISIKRGATKRRTFDEDNLTCTICFERLKDLAISSLSCGHIFCTPCIVKSIQQKKLCPTCNRAANVRHLRRIYLTLE